MSDRTHLNPDLHGSKVGDARAKKAERRELSEKFLAQIFSSASGWVPENGSKTHLQRAISSTQKDRASKLTCPLVILKDCFSKLPAALQSGNFRHLIGPAVLLGDSEVLFALRSSVLPNGSVWYFEACWPKLGTLCQSGLRYVQDHWICL